MSNIHGLFSSKKKKDDDDSDEDDSNNRYVGGIGDRGGGSGLAVKPNRDSENGTAGIDAVFGRAEDASNVNDNEREQIRRVITMYRDGFVVDDGPYRRLDDPANADFLRSLAMGRTPRELVENNDSSTGQSNVVVGLVDKRNEDYVEQFQSFSGQGASLGTSIPVSSGVFNPTEMQVDASNNVEVVEPSTSIAVRLLNGKRKVIKISLSSTVRDLALQLLEDASGSSFRLIAGYPPSPLIDETQTIESSGLIGAQVSMQKV